MAAKRPDPSEEDHPIARRTSGGHAPGPGDGHDAGMTETSASAPSKVPSPVLVASWERLGLLPADRVPLWAAYWIAGGHDGEALIHLAGLHGDDSREVHDALPGALMDCGVEMPDSDVAAAGVVFAQVARLHVDGLVGPLWVMQEVDRVVYVSKSRDSAGVEDLPLGKVWHLDWQLLAHGRRFLSRRSLEELTAAIRKACEEQLRSSSAA